MDSLRAIREFCQDAFGLTSSGREKYYQFDDNNKEFVDIEFKNLTADKLDEAVDVAIDTMRRDSRAIEFKICESDEAVEQMKMVLREVAKDGCSTIVIDQKKDQIIAVCFNKIRQPRSHHHNNDLTKFIRANVTNSACLYFLHFMDCVVREATEQNHPHYRNIFCEPYNSSSTVQIFYLGTSESVEQRGLALELCKFTFKFFKLLMTGEASKVPIGQHPMPFESVTPDVVYGVFANARSKYFAELLHCCAYPMVYYEDFRCQVGRKADDRGETDESTVPKLCVYYL